MKQVQQTAKAVHFPFFKRVQIQDRQFLNRKQSKYTLVGLGKCTNTYMDIYKKFFPSIYKKTTKLPQQKIERHHLSQFFNRYLTIVIIQYHTSFQQIRNLTDRCTKIYQGFSFFVAANQQESKQYDSFLRFLSRDLNTIVEEYAHSEKKNGINHIAHPFQILREAKRKIKKQLQFIKNWLNTDFEKIDKTQYFYQFKAKNYEERKQKIIMNIMSSFISLASIELTSTNRAGVLFNFVNANRSIWRIQINQILDRTSYRIGTTKEQNQLEVLNDFIMPHHSKDKNPILMRLKDFIPLLHQSKNNGFVFNHHQKEAIKDLLRFVICYKQKTNLFYPNLETKELYWDQKKLKIIVSYNPLIESAYGFDKNIKTFEMRTAFDNTPELISENCHKENEEQNWILLKFKFYHPSIQELRQRTSKQVETKDSVDPRPLQDSIFKEITKPRENIYEIMNKIDRLQEDVHVWRLLSILYFISKNDSLSKYSLQSYRRTAEGSKQAISKQSLQKAKHWLYNKLQTNDKALQELLKPIFDAVKEQKQSKKEISNGPSKKFQFKLSSLQSSLGLEEEGDSLLDGLKNCRALSFIHLRQSIAGQISEMLSNRRIFTAFPNVKKYMMLIMVYLQEQVHFLQFQLGHNYQRRKQLKGLIKKKYNGIVLEQERLRRVANANKIMSKFDEYENRKDKNKEYLASNANIRHVREAYQNINRLKERTETINFILDPQRPYEEKIPLINKQLSQFQKSQEDERAFSAFFQLAYCKNHLEQASIQINSININNNKQSFFNNLLKRAPDSLRVKMIRDLIDEFKIPLNLPQVQSNNPSNSLTDHAINFFWRDEKMQSIFIQNTISKIDLPLHSCWIFKMLRRHNVDSEYKLISQQVVGILQSKIKNQLLVVKQKLRVHYNELFSMEIVSQVNEIKKFFLGKENQGKIKLAYYQFLIYKIAALITLSLTPDSVNFSCERLYNTIFKGFDADKEKKNKNSLSIFNQKIEKIKLQILPFRIQSPIKYNNQLINNIQSLINKVGQIELKQQKVDNINLTN